MAYVDGFVLPIPKKHLAAYQRLSKGAGKIWRELGALDYRECVGDDLKIKGTVSFEKVARAKPGETVVFAWIFYRSKAQRDRVNAKVMKDPRILKQMSKKHPFDMKRMAYGGFRVFVSA